MLMVFGASLGRDARSVRSPLLGKPAPDIDLERIDTTGRLRSSDLRGRLYIVNFWASWCVPCRTETPALEDFYQRWRPRGIEIVGILFEDERDAALDFRRAYGGTYPLVDDPGARTAIAFGVRGVPETFVVDERGVIMAKLIGAVDVAGLEEVLAKIGAGATVAEQNDEYRPTPPG